MALSPSLKFGQIIGNILEETIKLELYEVAKIHNLYLDYKHPRAARAGKSKVTWKDHKGNNHDLDFTLESGGSDATQGIPKAFIETAWRRYTKHSRNKAQEMQGAIGPLAETYSKYNPFLGVVLAGVFTEGSLQQLRSHGFAILYFPYEVVVDAFLEAGVDALFDESTTDEEMTLKIDSINRIGDVGAAKVSNALITKHKSFIKDFFKDLDKSLMRRVTSVSVSALHGPVYEMHNINEALKYIEAYDQDGKVSGFLRFEMQIRYTNGDNICGKFENKLQALVFLRSLI
ncbi:MAG: DNA methylase [Planctomycetota bacterium]|nr:MAG: DNA methylase [Planctomycetota bacterium]